MPDGNENKYVTHGFLKEKEYQIYRYIDEGDQQIRDLYFKLDKKIDLDAQRSKRTIEQQKKMVDGIDKLNTNFIHFDKRITDVETKTKTNSANIKELSQIAEEKAKGNRDVLVAIITSLGVIGAAAFGFAQVFF